MLLNIIQAEISEELNDISNREKRFQQLVRAAEKLAPECQ